ncbi:MAG: hypothetical protein K0R28_3012, partial [Paenibacillus sp.]|nr:hypothetical protein [Paenibacillus sp.]
SPVIEERKKLAKELMKQWKDEGHQLCYIGDVTIKGNSADTRDFYNFCVELGMEGYLVLGNPVPDIGLKWESISEDVGSSDHGRPGNRRLFVFNVI